MKLLSGKTFSTAAAGFAAFAMFTAAVVFISASTGLGPAAKLISPRDQAAIKGVARQTLAQMPLAFEVNRGQTDQRADFITRGKGYLAFLSAGEAAFKLGDSSKGASESALRMNLIGADPGARRSVSNRLPSKVNYFTGSASVQGLPTYAKIGYRGIYPGIDISYYGKAGQLEYDFIVAPGADPKAIKLAFDGADRLSVGKNGDLIISVGDHKLTQRKPYLYQEIAGRRETVPGGFRVSENTVTFDTGKYDPARTLVIDPVLSYRSYLGGGANDIGFGVAVDSSGAAYITGSTQSTNYPTVGGVSGCAGTFTTTSLQCDKGAGDAFVTKMVDGGSALAWSTYLGGAKEDLGWDVQVDSSGNVYVGGSTESSDFPTTANAFDTTCGSDGTCNAPTPGGLSASDVFLAKLNSSGDALSYSTFLGGSDVDLDTNPAAGALGDLDIALRGTVAAITAATASSDFPTTSTGDRHCGTTGVVLGCNLTNDGFLSLIDTAKSGVSSLVYSTYIGGNGDDQGKGVAFDSKGDVYVAGITFGFRPGPSGTPLINNFPATTSLQPLYGGGASDGFVAKFATSGLIATGSVAVKNVSASFSAGAGSLIFSTYLGGGGTDEAWDVDVKGENAYVTGFTESGDDPATPAADGPTPYFPVTPGAFDTTYNGRPSLPDGSTAFLSGDAFVAKLKPAGEGLVYSTFLGSNTADVGMGIDVDSTGAAYVTGYTHCETPVLHLGPVLSSIQIGFPQSGNGTQRIGPATTSTSASYTVHARATGSSASASDPLDLPAGTLVNLTAVPDPVSGKAVVFSNGLDNITVAVDGLGNASDSVTPVDAVTTGIARVKAQLAANPAATAEGLAEWGYPAPTCTGNFPTTAGAPQPSINGDFLGAELHNSPADPFLTKLDPTGSALAYSTYLGGNDFDRGYAVAVRELPSGNEAYVTGRTGSTLIGTAGSAFPTKPSGKGNRDAYIAKVTEP
ncbi:MAG: SBBP repeat-containing protein [Actinomycetota bacterium]